MAWIDDYELGAAIAPGVDPADAEKVGAALGPPLRQSLDICLRMLTVFAAFKEEHPDFVLKLQSGYRSQPSTYTAVQFNSEVYDPNGWHR